MSPAIKTIWLKFLVFQLIIWSFFAGIGLLFAFYPLDGYFRAFGAVMATSSILVCLINLSFKYHHIMEYKTLPQVGAEVIITDNGPVKFPNPIATITFKEASREKRIECWLSFAKLSYWELGESCPAQVFLKNGQPHIIISEDKGILCLVSQVKTG